MKEKNIDNEKILRYFRGDYSDDDRSYVEKVFYDRTRDKDLKLLLSHQFEEMSNEDDSDRKNLDHILYRIHYEINTRSSVRKTWTLSNIIKTSYKIAGIVMISVLILIGAYMVGKTSQEKETWVEIHAPAWSRIQFALPDGTTGWLNSNSTVKYKGTFSSHREVALTGEAYFDVFKDKTRPFIVNTGDVNLKVLGTRFNITSYHDEKNVEVVLEEGKLVFTSNHVKKPYTMKPNDLVTYDKIHKDFTIQEVQPQKYLAWTEGKLVFRNDPIDVIARKLERWYNIDVQINGDFPDDLRLRATFVGENLKEVLDLLSRSLHIECKIEDRDLQPDGTYLKKKVIISQIDK
jgi:transmembrane sensor